MNHIIILDTEILQHINYIIGTMFFAFSGSYIQELLSIYRGSQKTIRLHKIIIGTIIGGLLYLVVQNKYFASLGITLTTVINVFSGSIGYEIFNRCSSIENMKKLANDINDIIRNIFGLDSMLKNKAKEEEEEENHSNKKRKKEMEKED